MTEYSYFLLVLNSRSWWPQPLRWDSRADWLCFTRISFTFSNCYLVNSFSYIVCKQRLLILPKMSIYSAKTLFWNLIVLRESGRTMNWLWADEMTEEGFAFYYEDWFISTFAICWIELKFPVLSSNYIFLSVIWLLIWRNWLEILWLLSDLRAIKSCWMSRFSSWFLAVVFSLSYGYDFLSCSFIPLIFAIGDISRLILVDYSPDLGGCFICSGAN